MYVKYSEYGERYLPHKNFIHLCSSLGIKKLGSDIDEKWLEYLEKNKILLPEYRIVKPAWYLNYFYKYNYTQLEKIKSKKWKQLDNLFQSIENWETTFFVFHPFDKQKIKSDYLIKPSISNFSRWRINYTKRIKNEERYLPKGRDVHYYPYWRAYQVYEINKVCTQKYLVNVFDKETSRRYNSLRRIPCKKAKIWTLPSSPEIYFKEIFGEDNNFDMLSFYIQSVRRAGQVPRQIQLLELSDVQEVRDNYYAIIKNRKICIATTVIEKYKLTIERLMIFLKYLCEKYFRYEDESLLKLSYMLRFDIIYLRNLLIDGFNLSNLEIEKKLGKISFKHHTNPLRYIFMGELAEARQDAYRIFEDFVKRTFIINKIDMPKNEFEEFLTFLDENDMDAIYVTIYDHYYLPSDYRKYRNPISSLAALAVYFESYLRSLIILKYGVEGTDWLESKGEKNNEKKSLKDFINKLLSNEKWRGELNCFWKRKLSVVTKTNINNLEKEILNTSFHETEQWNELIKVFALIGAIRNYIAHDFFNFYKSSNHYDIYFRFIISAFWYCWKQANSLEKKQ